MNFVDPVVAAPDVKRDTWFSVPGAPHVVLDAARATHFRFVPELACALVVINPSSGRRILIRIEQGGVGYAVTPDSSITGLVAADISTTASAVTVVELLYDEITATWQKIAYLTAYGAGLLYQPLDATLTAFAAVTFAADKGVYATGADAFATFDLSAFGRTWAAKADEAAGRTALSLGSIYPANIVAAQADFAGADLAALKAELNAWKAKFVTAGVEAS